MLGVGFFPGWVVVVVEKISLIIFMLFISRDIINSRYIILKNNSAEVLRESVLRLGSSTFQTQSNVFFLSQGETQQKFIAVC